MNYYLDLLSSAGLIAQYGISTIGIGAFKNCKKLKSVIIGKSIVFIEKNAFYGCKNLRKVTFKTKILRKIGKKAFKGTHKNIKFKCPKKKLKKYKRMIRNAGASKKAFITSKKI